MLTHHLPTPYSPSELTTLIATHYPEWQVCFLNNAHRPVIGLCPAVSWTAVFDNGLIIHQKMREQNEQIYSSTYSDWQNELITYCQTVNHDDINNNDDYTHGLMGFIGYDISAHALNPTITIKENQPCAYMGHYDMYLKPCENGFELIGMNAPDDIFEKIKTALVHLIKLTPPNATPLDFKSIWTRDNYAHAFYQTQEYIKAGDTYQINLTQCWQADNQGNLANHLPNLQHKMNAPFAGYIQLNDFELLSASPELFFQFYQENQTLKLITKPIKGTRPRHDDAYIDELLKNELANSQKDMSENVMIVDLLRNDLGKYAKVGTVKTPKRFAIESFKNVHHMVSTVQAELNDTHPIGVLFGSLPAGSITGTPKKRACEIIHELEVAPRGAYCGTMGYVNFDGTGVWNVLIRTAQKSDKTELWAGGGITIKSALGDEYQECSDKVGAILNLMENPNSE